MKFSPGCPCCNQSGSSGSGEGSSGISGSGSSGDSGSSGTSGTSGDSGSSGSSGESSGLSGSGSGSGSGSSGSSGDSGSSSGYPFCECERCPCLQTIDFVIDFAAQRSCCQNDIAIGTATRTGCDTFITSGCVYGDGPSPFCISDVVIIISGNSFSISFEITEVCTFFETDGCVGSVTASGDFDCNTGGDADTIDFDCPCAISITLAPGA